MKKGISIILLIIICLVLYKPDLQVSTLQTLTKKIIVLDPGHGGLDNGASVGKVNEDELNLKICFALKSELENRGATVYLTRTDDQDMTKRNHHYSKQDDMYLRALKIDEYKPHLFMSIHLNSSHSSAWGSQVFYYKKSKNGKVLAETIHKEMKTITGTKKSISSCEFYVLRATQSLGVLIECGFISNANERGQLKNSRYHKKLAKSICDGVEKYFQSL